MKARFKTETLSFLGLVLLVGALVTFIARQAADEKGISTENFPSGRNVASSREPASIQKVFDFSYLQGDALVSASKQRLANSVTIEAKADGTTIQMGNFVMLNDNNQKDFACGVYDRVRVSFEAEGVAVSGEKPTLTVEAPCEVGANLNTMAPIHIPVTKLKAQKPSNTEYKFYDSNKPVSIQFANPPDEWPGQWTMSEIKMTNSQNSSRILHISNTDLRESNNRPVTMKW